MAIDLNRVVLTGRLTRDPELKYTNSGTPVSNPSIAVNGRKKSGNDWVDDPNFFDLEVWGKNAENLAQYMVKGQEITVEGRLRQQSWEQDGQKRSRVTVVVELFKFGAKPGQNGGSRPQGGNADPVEHYSAPSNGYASSDGFEDDIPF